MFHLLSNVYVESEFQASPNDNQINISPLKGFQRLDNPMSIGLKAQLAWGQSLDDFTPNEFYAMLLRAVEYRDKVYIFTDTENYTRMYALLIFALFPNIDYATFRMFFICIKATYATTTVTFYDRLFNHEMAIVINQEVVDKLWARKDDPLIKPMARLVKAMPDAVSMEWRIIKAMATKEVGTLPETILNIMQRTAMGNSLDAMDDWGRVIVDPTRFDFSGCTLDSLLSEASIFEACVNFGPLALASIRDPSAKSIEHDAQWYVDLLGHIVAVLNDCGDYPSANRSEMLRNLFLEDLDMTVYENMFGRLKSLFDGEKAHFRLSHTDSAKYNENLIRHVVRLDDAAVEALMEGSTW